MLEDFRLRVFEAVERCGSFTSAAKELGVSQPAVSQNIAELEKQLGEQLFNRERGNVTLTDKGRLFKGYAEQILHWYRVADEAFRGPSVFQVGEKDERQLTLKLTDSRQARIWSSQGDIHICLEDL